MDEKWMKNGRKMGQNVLKMDEKCVENGSKWTKRRQNGQKCVENE
jgi:hypothetical protein